MRVLCNYLADLKAYRRQLTVQQTDNRITSSDGITIFAEIRQLPSSATLYT